ncbi:hypothetical protein [Winogradskya consettensis]|uniref:hypothetical protein n=1 Tax=Winogradskya consettensis TaxID=113560 RepID=UPI001BB3912E|nr:hypothetical protein [Actinoplanes consettensis]
MVPVLQSPISHVLPRSVVLLRYVSTTGATITLPVQAAQDSERFVVLVGNAGRKRWWRHFRRAASAEVWLDGESHHVVGEVVDGTGEAASFYRRRFPRTAGAEPAVFVELRCDSRTPSELRRVRCPSVGS